MWQGLALRGAWGLARGLTSLKGLAIGGILDQLVTGGEGRRWAWDQIDEPLADGARSAASGLTGIDLENFEQLKEDLENGNFEDLLANPMLMGAAGLATAALKIGVGGNGIINSVFTGLLVAGAVWAAQKYALPMVFGNNAADPNAPAPEAAPSAPAIRRDIAGPEMEPN
jgi:hypothetical protein